MSIVLVPTMIKLVFVVHAFAFFFTVSQALDLYLLTAHDAVGNVVPLEQYRGKVRTYTLDIVCLLPWWVHVHSFS